MIKNYKILEDYLGRRLSSDEAIRFASLSEDEQSKYIGWRATLVRRYGLTDELPDDVLQEIADIQFKADCKTANVRNRAFIERRKQRLGLYESDLT